jgi:hypothetical protein
MRGESAGGMSRTGREIGSEYRLWYTRPLIYFCIPLTTVLNYMRRRSEVVNWKDMGMKHEEKDGNAGLVPHGAIVVAIPISAAERRALAFDRFVKQVLYRRERHSPR